ncbi:MAG: M48 family metalloprotease, partial [Clostridia bacterium]|nr:M48 family metalloprotease [Clostridia bacterium]
MSQIFETILSMSIGASVLAVLVLAARAIIGRRQTVVLTILFAMLIAKLVVPLSIESRISIFNILPEAVAQSAQIDTIGTPIEDDAVIAAISDEGTSAAEQGGTVAQADADEETAAVLVPETNTNGAADVVPAPNGADAVAMLDTYANEAVLGDGTAIVQAQLNANTAEVSTDTSGRAPPKAPMSAIDILAIVWLAGIAVMVSIIAASNIAFMRKVRRNRAYTSPGFDEMLSQCADDLRIRQKIGAVRMSDINTVAVCGIFRPKLLISPQVFDALGEQEKRHVIMHELGHIKRKDTLVCLILTIVNVLHWFNPLVWIAFVLFRKDLEIMCDSKVLRGLPRAERSRYANTLLTLVGKTGTKRNRLAMAMFMSKAGIKRRIAMIAKYKRNKPIVVALALILAVGIAITGCTVGTTDISKIGEWEAVEIGDLELLASHTIDYSDYVGDKARVHNIKKAAELLNGIRIGPDEQVDLLYTIGPITTENGWRNASGVSWETVILLLGHEDTENETTLGADPHTVQTGGGVGLVATAYCIVGVNARMDQVISGDMEGLITQGDAGLHNWFDIDVVFETIEDGDTIIVNLYGPGNFDEQMERLQAENREGIVDRETSTEFLTVYTFGKLSVDLSFCADDENILSNIVKTMDELEGKVFSPGKPETLMSSEIYEEDGWETAPARSWQDIGGLEPENIGYIENLETQLQRGGGSEIVLAAVKGAAIEAGLSVTSLDPSEAVLNEFTEDVKLFLMMRDNTLHAVFTSEESPEQTKGDLYVFYGEDVTVGNLRIIADTQVVAPERDKVVAFNVKAANFTQEQVDGLIEAFFDGESVYELELGPVMTKAQVKEILDMWKQRKAATSGEWATEENQAWCDEVIERWEQKYL